MFLYQNNTRPHTVRMIFQRLEQIQWETMHHPSYSLDIAPFDYHLNPQFSKPFGGKNMNSVETVRTVFFVKGKRVVVHGSCNSTKYIEVFEKTKESMF